MKQKRFSKILTLILSIIMIILTYNVLKHYYPNNIITKILNGFTLVITPTLTALFITYLMEPFMHYLRDKLKFNKFFSVLTTTLIVILVLVAFVVFISVFAYNQMRNIIENIIASNFLDDVKTFFMKYNLEKLYTNISEYFKNLDLSNLLTRYSPKIITLIGQSFTIILLTPIFLWHFLNSRKELFLNIGKLVPNQYKEEVFAIASRSNDVINSYFKSKLLSMIFLFFAFLALFFLLGMPVGYVFFFALMITIFDLVPYIGPFIGNVIPIIYLFSNGGTNLLYLPKLFIGSILASIILIGINFIIQFVQGNLIMPKIAGKEMKIHPLVILSSMLFFGAFLGFWGVVLSIPLGGIIIVVYKYYHAKNNPDLLTIPTSDDNNDNLG